MVMYFSIDWNLKKRNKHVIQIEITFLDEKGNCIKKIKYYEDWIGICTNNIDHMINSIKQAFPGHKVLYKEIGQVKKVLPYFEDRLAKSKLDYQSKPFYKVYTSAPHKNVGQFFNKYKIAYFNPDEWLIRIYIDFCTQYDTHAFYYRWYEIDDKSNGLMNSLKMIPDRIDQPDWTIAAFDLEAVPLKGNHIPIGHHESDRIVMLSVCKWNSRIGYKKWLLYVLPEGGEPLPGYDDAFKTESEMLIKFHSLLDDAQIITGYNINAFDFPCIYARLIWLELYKLIKLYTSVTIGSDLVVIYNNKIVIDLYSYFKTYSGHNLPSFKLDDVARIKLEGETKLQVKSTGIWSWYRNCSLAARLLNERDVETCFKLLNPKTVLKASEFGTFKTYLDYCLKDSELVYKLFEKENVLSFLVEHANLTALNVMEALHLGNSRYLLELFKTYGLRLGYFVNPKFFVSDPKYEKFFKGKTYQGALNYCVPEQTYENVSVMDFTSMYPSTLLSNNLCYGTCTIMTRDEWLSNESAQQMVTIPYRQHSDVDFTTDVKTSNFSYPAFDPNADDIAIVINTRAEAFLPKIISHFIEMRKYHQKEWKRTKNVYHYNKQQSIKILSNSFYGVMASKDSPLAYLAIAMIIVTLSRYQLLGSYHYLKNLGYNICYADTDSLMVENWPLDNCDQVNAFLNLPHVELKYEKHLERLLVISKKRYIYEQSMTLAKNKAEWFEKLTLNTKGFQKKINGIVSFMTENILKNVWWATFEDPKEATPANGWIIWVETLLKANYLCRDPKKYSIYRKMKDLSEYKSISCPSVKFLKKYPDRVQEHVDFTYSRADVAAKEALNWIMDVDDCQWVNFEQLFKTQKRIFCLLLNMTFWHLPDPTFLTDMVLNTLNWKRFVHAELLHWHATDRKLALLVEPGIKYTFQINDHLTVQRRAGRKRRAQ